MTRTDDLQVPSIPVRFITDLVDFEPLDVEPLNSSQCQVSQIAIQAAGGLLLCSHCGKKKTLSRLETSTELHN